MTPIAIIATFKGIKQRFLVGVTIVGQIVVVGVELYFLKVNIFSRIICFYGEEATY
jgi:hypothetical protein